MLTTRKTVPEVGNQEAERKEKVRRARKVKRKEKRKEVRAGSRGTRKEVNRRKEERAGSRKEKEEKGAKAEAPQRWEESAGGDHSAIIPAVLIRITPLIS